MTTYFRKNISTNNAEKPFEVLQISLEYTKGGRHKPRGLAVRFLQCEVKEEGRFTSTSYNLFDKSIVNAAVHVLPMGRDSKAKGRDIAIWLCDEDLLPPSATCTANASTKLTRLYDAAMARDWDAVRRVMAEMPLCRDNLNTILALSE